MDKPFRPAPIELLARWIFGELESRDSVMGIPQANFAVPGPRVASRMLGHTVAAPLGVAAGPHTQLAQNIVASWLCGARFIELKTVQILDEIAVSRPCIDSADETYNCEWSQELKLEQSYDEYLNAWVLVHALAHRMGLADPGTHFAMSVGYDLAGIQTPRVQRFIASLRDASEALPAAVEAVAKVYPAVRDIEIPVRISDHITLSTMHGCPPAEIERIAGYLLTELGVDTWVKLNPTLLGPDRLRSILNRTLGFDIEVPDAAFEHDPRFEDAMTMVRNLAEIAAGRPQSFGLKLSNTLEVVNRRPVFPAAEKMMYMSGRSLHPLTLTLAGLVTDELDGRVPISFCGGADARNFADLVADGLGPVTVCTDLLKPGGYARLQQYLVNLDAAMADAGADSIEAFVHARSGGRGARFNLARHAESVARDARYASRERPLVFKGPRALDRFDCIAAPCQEACPAHQNIADYLWLVGHGRPSDALDVILRTNPQPGMTGSICDHPCTERCVRNFYDAPLAIREVKRFAFEHGEASPERAGPPNGIKVAIVGAGPAGLAAAYYLCKSGFAPVLFDARAAAGGTVNGVVPGYRLAGDAIEQDVDRLRALGVPIAFGKALGRDMTLDQLRRDYPYVFLAIGAQRGKRLAIDGETADGVVDALEFLNAVRAKRAPALGRRILVVGGGNSAMDAARTARRLVPDGEVSIVYRRTRAEMPADTEEVLQCIEEGAVIRDLLAPSRIVTEGGRVVGLACTRMILGPPDDSGRPRPVPAGGEEMLLPADAVIPAIGQEPVLDFLDGLDVARRRDGTLVVDATTCETSVAGLFAGGDVSRGAASVIKAIADGHAVATEIGRRHGIVPAPEPALDKQAKPAALLDKKARSVSPQTVPVLPVAERTGFAEVVGGFGPEAAMREASRCLDCDDLCSLCVTVCPNRANLAYTVSPFSVTWPSLVARGGALVEAGAKPHAVGQSVQIVNIGDYCNECGNCTTFCPTAGAPYQEKPRFWIDDDGWREARGDAFRLVRSAEATVVEARLGGRLHSLERRDGTAVYRSETLVARLEPRTWAWLSSEPTGALADGEPIDLAPCATLIALLDAEPVLPGH
jgi:putative selenate reductase